MIEFHKKIYSQESIRKALKDFGAFGLQELKPSRTHYRVDYDEAEAPESTADEFKNYVLYFNLTDADQT